MGKIPTPEQVWEFVKSETNPATEYEIRVINAILGATIPKDAWRFKKDVHCEACNRELTILDYFLTGIQHHSIQGIKTFILSGEEDVDIINVEINPDKFVKFDITDHPNPIGCVSCGHVTPMGHDVYGHPVKNGGGVHVRMPQDFYERLIAQLS